MFCNELDDIFRFLKIYAQFRAEAGLLFTFCLFARKEVEWISVELKTNRCGQYSSVDEDDGRTKVDFKGVLPREIKNDICVLTVVLD